MKVEQFNQENKGFFKASDQDQQAGRMTYSWAGKDKFIIDHTEVNPKFKGQGVGSQLLDTAVAYAREHHLKIIPLCPFAKSQFDRREDIRDVLS